MSNGRFTGVVTYMYLFTVNVVWCSMQDIISWVVIVAVVSRRRRAALHVSDPRYIHTGKPYNCIDHWHNYRNSLTFYPNRCLHCMSTILFQFPNFAIGNTELLHLIVSCIDGGQVGNNTSCLYSHAMLIIEADVTHNYIPNTVYFIAAPRSNMWDFTRPPHHV